MTTEVKVERRDSSNYSMDKLSLTEQSQVEELVHNFLLSDNKVKAKVLKILTKNK